MSPNDIVEIKPTEEGWLEIIKFVDETNDRLRMHQRLRHRMSVPTANADGYIRGQFWSLMQFFDWTGSHAGRDIHFYDLLAVPERSGSASGCSGSTALLDGITSTRGHKS